jgi:DNA-binding transcriptional MocR family regulator
MFSADRAFRNCIRLNYGHAWDARTEAAMATLGRLVAAQLQAGRGAHLAL